MSRRSAKLVICIEFYVEDCLARGQSNSTVYTKRILLAGFAKWCLSENIRLVTQLDLNSLEDYRRFLSCYRKARDGEPLDLATQRMRLMAVTGFLERLYYFGIIKSDFFVYFKLPRVNRRLPADVPDEIEMEQVLRQAMTKGKMAVRDRAILEVYYATGVRRTELANLDIKDIDFKHQLVTVRKGKGSLDRRVPIATRAINWVRQYLKELRPNLQNLDSGEALFLGATGKRIRPSKLSGMVSACVQRSGVGKSGSCHLFRHAAATAMLRNGADIRYVQEMLGHLDITSTQIYTRVTVMDLTRVYNDTHPAARH
jgi:integrase/recombinase XerD